MSINVYIIQHIDKSSSTIAAFQHCKRNSVRELQIAFGELQTSILNLNYISNNGFFKTIVRFPTRVVAVQQNQPEKNRKRGERGEKRKRRENNCADESENKSRVSGSSRRCIKFMCLYLAFISRLIRISKFSRETDRRELTSRAPPPLVVPLWSRFLSPPRQGGPKSYHPPAVRRIRP